MKELRFFSLVRSYLREFVENVKFHLLSIKLQLPQKLIKTYSKNSKGKKKKKLRHSSLDQMRLPTNFEINQLKLLLLTTKELRS